MEYIYSNPSFLLQKFFVRVTNSSTRKSNSLLTHSNQSFDSTDLSDCCTTDFQNRPPSFTRPLIQSWSPWCVFLSKRDREGLWSKGGRGMDASQRRIDPMVSCIGPQWLKASLSETHLDRSSSNNAPIQLIRLPRLVLFFTRSPSPSPPSTNVSRSCIAIEAIFDPD